MLTTSEFHQRVGARVRQPLVQIREVEFLTAPKLTPVCVSNLPDGSQATDGLDAPQA